MSTMSSISSATSSSSSLSLGKSGPSSRASDQVIESLIKRLRDFGYDPYFRSAVADAYIALLKKDRNINVQHKGLSILHYCSYTSSYCPRNDYLELMEELLRQGADPNIKDAHGRTPLFFQSTGGKFMTCLVEAGAKIDSENPSVKPLHVVVCLLWKKALPLLEAGAHAYALDKFGRTPLHCAVLYSAVCPLDQFEMNNVRDLLKYAPLSTEYTDIFKNYPLYYAFLYGSPKLIKFLSSKTPVLVVRRVLQKLQQERRQGQYAAHDVLEDGIYQIDSQFFPAVGGGRHKGRQPQPNKQKVEKKEEKKLDQRIETYKKRGICYSLRPDSHGKKHIKNIFAFKNKDLRIRKNKNAFLDMTKGGAATFYPEIAAEYNDYLAQCIRKWVDEGADLSHQFVKFSGPIGASEGRETSWVQLYYCDVTHSHMRPICEEHVKTEKAAQEKELEGLKSLRSDPEVGKLILSYLTINSEVVGAPSLLQEPNKGKKPSSTKIIQKLKHKK